MRSGIANTRKPIGRTISLVKEIAHSKNTIFKNKKLKQIMKYVYFNEC